MTITNDKPHRRHGNGYGVAFWKGNVASNEEEADRAVIYSGAPGMPYPEFNFELPAQLHEMTKMEAALQKAFASGVYAGKAEVRKVLGVHG
jgi:hypothetical protein